MEIPPTCNQLKFNTCKAKVSCMLTHVILLKPKTKTWPAMNKLHLTFSLIFSTNYNIQEASLFPRVNTNQNFLPYFSLFSLKEIARSSLKSLLSNPRVHTLKKDKAHLISSFYSFKATRIVKNTLPFIPTGPTPKERKTLNSPLPFTPTSPAATRISFNSS